MRIAVPQQVTSHGYRVAHTSAGVRHLAHGLDGVALGEAIGWS